MIGSLVNVIKTPELRKKILITLGLCLVFRVGTHVPTPFIDPQQMASYFERLQGSQGGGVFAFVDMFSGRAFSKMTIFALGVMPYISASIILQILTVVWPRLEKISKEGDAGRKKINQWTRYGTVILSLIQGAGIAHWLYSDDLTLLSDHPIMFYITTAITLSAGTCFVMWLGEKITEHGIGNGISLLIAIGIVSDYPYDLRQGWVQTSSGLMSPLAFVAVLASMAMFAAMTLVNQIATRKIPIQHARRVVGRKVMQGGNTFLPLKLNTAGVIPVIFSSALLSFPQMFMGFFGAENRGMFDWLGHGSQRNMFNWFGNMFNTELTGVFNLLKIVNVWTISYVILTAFFCYLYTALTFNPVDIADNLKKSGAFVPGRKPGKQTSDFINFVLVRITVVGALFLVAIALAPDIFAVGFGIPYQFATLAGGTGLIIVVGVFYDTMKQIESQLLMRHYEGFRYRGAGAGSARRARR